MLVILFGMDISVLFILAIMVLGNRVAGFMFMELIFVVVLACVWVTSSTYERRGAVSYLWFFSLLVGFIMISSFDMYVISLFVVFVILAKLPLVRLHMWLPKVHAEASMLGSIFLARLILKAGSVLYYMVGAAILYVLIALVLMLLIMCRTMDGKVIVALSSVLHMTISVVVVSMI